MVLIILFSIMMNSDVNGSAEATFGAGCFWCVEAVFEMLEGVEHVEAGYTGGHVKNPTYKEVCDGTTGHAEVIRIKYDPSVISYADLLEAFFKAHDPTTLNRQGNDVGTQYRSVIFYHDEAQKKQATEFINRLNADKAFGKPVVTEVSPLKEYYKAENYHQNYFKNNPNQPYCAYVVKPKVDKFLKEYSDKLKKEYQK